MAITRKQVTRDIGTDVGERGPLLTNGGNVTEAATERISEWISSKKKMYQAAVWSTYIILDRCYGVMGMY